MGDVKYMRRPGCYLIYQTITITTHRTAQHSSHLFIIEKKSGARSQVQRGNPGPGAGEGQTLFLGLLLYNSVCLSGQDTINTGTDCHLDTKEGTTTTSTTHLTWFLGHGLICLYLALLLGSLISCQMGQFLNNP